jgi:hypothetical protein
MVEGYDCGEGYYNSHQGAHTSMVEENIGELFLGMDETALLRNTRSWEDSLEKIIDVGERHS